MSATALPLQPQLHPCLHTRLHAGLRPLALACLLAGTALMPAQAQTWTGAGFTNNWGEAQNWAGLTRPVSGPGTAVTFAGGVRLNPLQNMAAVFQLNSLSFASNAGAFSLGGGALRFAGSTPRLQHDGSVAVSIANDIQIVDSLVYQGNGSATFTGTLASANTNAAFQPLLTKRGSGVLSLTAASSFGGRVVVEEGQVRIRDGLALQAADVTVQAANGLDLSQTNSITLGGLSGSGALTLGSTQLTVGGSNNTLAAYTGNLTATTGTLTKVGTGTLQLGGTSTLDALRVLQGGVVLDGGSLTLDVGGEALVVGDQTAGPSGGANLSVRGGTQLNVTGSTALVDGREGTQMQLSGAGTRVTTGFQALVGIRHAGRLEVGNGATFAAQTYLIAGFGDGSRGVIDVTAGGSVNSVAAVLGTLAGSHGSGSVSGEGASWQTLFLGMGGLSSSQSGGTGLLRVGPGGVVTVGVLDFWGDDSVITVDGGQLSVGQLLSAPASTGSVRLARDPTGGAALALTGGVATFAGNISGPGSVSKSGGGTQVLAGSNTFTGAVTVDAGELVMPNSAASEYTASGTGTLRLGTPTLGQAVLTAQQGGRIVYTAPTVSGGLLAGPGQHDISAVQRLVGSSVGNGATLTPASGSTFVGVANAGTVVNAAGRVLNWNQGGNTVGTLTVEGSTFASGLSSGGVVQVLPGGTLQHGGANLLLGGGSRTAIGSAAAPGGTLRALAGTSVQLNGGLLVNNGTLDGALVVNFGGLAKGAGGFGPVTVNDGGRFSPGNSPGTAQTGPVRWGAGGAYIVELAAAGGSAGVDWDLWAVDGALDIAAGTTANSRFTISVFTLGDGLAPGPLAGFDPLQPWSWTIARAAGGVQGFDPSRLALDTSGFASPTGGGSFALALDGSELQLVFAPVPEPGSALLFAMGAMGLWAGRRLRLQRRPRTALPELPDTPSA